MFAGCNKGFEDRLSDLENRVSVLEEYVTNLNNEVNGIQTIVTSLQSKVYVTGVEAVKNDSGAETGYKITFNQGNPIIINHGKTGDKGQTGAPGLTPGIDMFEGEWYWKYVGGDWILDSAGNKIPVAKSLRFEVNDGNLYVSIDGAQVELVGKVQGAQGDSWFDGVTVDEEAGTVTISIADSEHDLVLPFNAAAADDFALELQLPESTDVLLGGTIELSYTLAGCDAKDAGVFVQAPEDWKVAVDEAAQKITLTVGEKAGRVVVYAINNVTGEVRAKFVAYDPEAMLIVAVNDTKFYLDPTGGEFTIPVSTGISYRVENTNWLTVTKAPATKAVEHTVLTVTAGENASDSPREGEVNIRTSDGNKLLLSSTVEQKNYNPALLVDGEGNPIKWQETFGLKVGSTTTNFKNDVTIELSDDFTKGTYKVKNMFKADLFFGATGMVTNAGADYYADLEDDVLTVYKAEHPSYYFGGNVTLKVDLSEMTITSSANINCTTAGAQQKAAEIVDYKLEIPAPSQEGDENPILGSYLESFTSSGMSTAAPGGNLTIEASDNPSQGNVKVTSFLGQTNLSIYGTLTSTIEIAGDPGNYSLFLGNLGPCPKLTITIKDGKATFNESAISFPTISGYSAIGSTLLGSYLESFTSSGMSTAAPGGNLTIEASDNPSQGNVKVTSFLGQTNLSIYGTLTSTIEIAGDPGNYSLFLGNLGPCPKLTITIKDGKATFNESAISFPTISGYSAVKQ